MLYSKCTKGYIMRKGTGIPRHGVPFFQLKDANAEEDWFAFRTVDIAGDPVIAYATRLVYGRAQDVGCLGILGGYLDV